MSIVSIDDLHVDIIEHILERQDGGRGLNYHVAMGESNMTIFGRQNGGNGVCGLVKGLWD